VIKWKGKETCKKGFLGWKGVLNIFTVVQKRENRYVTASQEKGRGDHEKTEKDKKKRFID